MEFFKFNDELTSLEDVLLAKKMVCCELIKKIIVELDVQNTLFREETNKILSDFKRVAKQEEQIQYRFVLIPSLSISPEKVCVDVESILSQPSPRVRWYLYSRFRTGPNNRKDKIEVKRVTRSNEKVKRSVPSKIVDLAIDHDKKIKALIELATENRRLLRSIIKKQKQLLDIGVIYDI